LRESLAQALIRRGFEVTLASDADEALDAVHGGCVHLALVDVHMPRVTGLQLLAQLHAESCRLPFILMSAALDREICEEARKMRAYRVLSKPIRLPVLTQTISEGLAEHYGWAG
jgi:DNA-binding NtrC family response regulator